MTKQMKTSMPCQAARIAGFLFAGVAAVMAQSPANDTESNKTQLVALNTTTAPRTSQAQADGKSQASQLTMPGQVATQTTAAELVKKSVAPSVSPASLLQDQVASSSASSNRTWFTAGLSALPAPVRMDPTFGLPTNQYGVAPAAVEFRFGKK